MLLYFMDDIFLKYFIFNTLLSSQQLNFQHKDSPDDDNKPKYRE
jgi:hypothetical protein